VLLQHYNRPWHRADVELQTCLAIYVEPAYVRERRWLGLEKLVSWSLVVSEVRWHLSTKLENLTVNAKSLVLSVAHISKLT